MILRELTVFDFSLLLPKGLCLSSFLFLGSWTSSIFKFNLLILTNIKGSVIHIILPLGALILYNRVLCFIM